MSDNCPVAQAPLRRLLRRRVTVAVAVLALAFVIDYLAYPYGLPPGGRSYDRGENGLWLRYTWYFGQRSEADIKDLATQLAKHRIRYAYFHVRGITAAGALKYRYEASARRLVSTMHRSAPGVQAIAWVYAGNRRGEGEVDLGRSAVRRAMVREAVWLTTRCGFDGVQWDYEICQDGEPGLLALLEETRAALPPGKLLSAACPVWLPWPVSRWGWSEKYFTDVARRCDQVAVMCYDTGFVTPRAYVWLVRQQAIRVTRAVAQASPRCRVLLGVPSYGAGFRSHNPRAENIALALRGVREGLADPHAVPAACAGVAPFADYTTDADEWRTYDRLWAR